MPARPTGGLFLLIFTAALACADARASHQPEALERFEATTLRVWHIQREHGERVAYVLDADGYVYGPLRPGNFLGRHDGKIQRIDRCGFEYTEQMPDGEGNWTVARRYMCWESCNAFPKEMLD
jgi:Tfp pilus assembly protein PilP